MARVGEQVRPEWQPPTNPRQVQICDHIQQVLGERPEAIRQLSSLGEDQDACVVKWRGLELICACGMLFGIPPKRKGSK